MTVKEHYDNHLGFFYSWMIGNFDDKKEGFLNHCKNNGLFPEGEGVAVDLGAGNGIQSIALAELGFQVKAIDFNQPLLDELETKKNELPIEVINADLTEFIKYIDTSPELIICCGDTISHLESEGQISKLLSDIYDSLAANGKILLSFRDYTSELTDTKRFIPVKSDSDRILTCFLEYFEKKVRVTDLLYEKSDGVWVQKTSSYEKVRVTKAMIQNLIDKCGFSIVSDKSISGMIYLIGQKA